MEDIKIMVVDDEEVILESIKDYLDEYNIYTYYDSLKACNELKKNFYDVIVGDYKMPQLTGLDLLIEGRRYNSYSYGILLTAYADKNLLLEFINKDLIHKVIEKPLDLEFLKNTIDEAIQKCNEINQKEKEIDTLKHKYEEVLKSTGFLSEKIIGFDGGLKPIFEKIKYIGTTDENILITGETGTGKEVIARTIHSFSSRKDGPFVKINCGAIPDSLIESELFGYKKGAFSGAFEDKAGKIELADKGTLLLDEIAELKPELQSRLLHVVQEKTVERLGTNKSIHVNFRLITATNRNLHTSIKETRFREDLFYRISTFQLHLPPLRERIQDLEPLVAYLIEKYKQELERKDITISQNVAEKLKEYNWPGNIRELENVIKRAVILLDRNENEIKADAFDYLFMKPSLNSGSFQHAIDTIGDEMISRKLDLKIVEKQIVEIILQKCNGNVMEAVRKTAVSKDKFYRNMKKNFLLDHRV